MRLLERGRNNITRAVENVDVRVKHAHAPTANEPSLAAAPTEGRFGRNMHYSSSLTECIYWILSSLCAMALKAQIDEPFRDFKFPATQVSRSGMLHKSREWESCTCTRYDCPSRQSCVRLALYTFSFLSVGET